MTFSGSGWSETVALSDGTASVDVPDGVVEVGATYDGYRDGLVAGSDADPVAIGGALDVTTATRCVVGKTVLAVTAVNTGTRR